MEAHAIELLHAAIWVIAAIGGIGITVITWGGKKVLERLDEQDHTMIQIREILLDTERRMETMVHTLDLRLTRVEERCEITHVKMAGGNNGD